MNKLVHLSLAALAGIAILIGTWAVSASGGDEPDSAKPPFETTDHYAIREIDGWKVYVNGGFERDKQIRVPNAADRIERVQKDRALQLDVIAQ